jgi:predicted neuraminidase
MKLINQQKEFAIGEERPFTSCHASTIVALPNGDLLVAYFAGSKEGNHDVGIWCSKRKDGIWSEPRLAADEEDVVHWNPVLHRKPNGQILLFYKVGHPIPKWYTRVTVSDDNGETWSEPIDLVPGDIGGRGPVKNKLIELQDGTWLAPASLEGETWDVFVDISQDQGESWTPSDMVPIQRFKADTADEINLYTVFGKGLIQPTLWESMPGQVHMLARTTEGAIFRSDSSDSGRTWTRAYRTYLPNNNSGIDLDRMDDGTLVLAYNPIGQRKGPRTPLQLSYSKDNGVTWQELITLDGEYRSFSIPIEYGEFSYPAVIAVGRKLYVTYTWKRQNVAVWELEVEGLDQHE